MIDSEEQTGALAALIEAQPRPFKVWPVNNIFGVGGRPVVQIAIVLLYVAEDDDIITAAHRYVAKAAKKAELGEEAAKGDEDLKIGSKAMEALWRVCRDVKADGTPSEFAAFAGGPEWMRQHLRAEQIGALFNLYLATKSKFSLAPAVLEPGTIDALVALFASDLGGPGPDLALAPYERQDVINLAVTLGHRLSAAEEAKQALMEEREELLRDLRIAQMTECALREMAAKAEAKADGDEANLALAELARRGLDVPAPKPPKSAKK